jgi:transcriptional regulator with XRE-family HTH domain
MSQMSSGEKPKIGKNIQAVRKRQNMTLDVLSEVSGVSKAMLSQIEADKVNPTVATVWKIGRGLGVELETLLRGGEPLGKFAVTRRANATALDSQDENLHIEVLTPFSTAEDVEVYMLRFREDGALRSEPHAPRTEEFLTVLEGRVRVTAGESRSELGEGDFVLYNCDVRHDIENIGEGPARVHMVVRFNKQAWSS